MFDFVSHFPAGLTPSSVTATISVPFASSMELIFAAPACAHTSPSAQRGSAYAHLYKFLLSFCCLHRKYWYNIKLITSHREDIGCKLDDECSQFREDWVTEQANLKVPKIICSSYVKGTWEFYANLGKSLTVYMTLQIIHCEAGRDFSDLSVKSKFWLNMLEERLNYPSALCKKLFHKIFVWSSNQSVWTKNVGKKYYSGMSGSLWKYIIFLGFMILVFLSFIQFLTCDFLPYFKKNNFCVYLEFYVLFPGSTPVSIK